MNSITERAPRYTPVRTDSILIEPKEHQKASLFAMRMLEQRHIETENMYFDTNMGVLNDPVGYGKTITMLLHLLESEPLEPQTRFVPRRTDRYGKLCIYRRNTTIYTFLPITMIVIPKGIIHQWETSMNTQVLIPHMSIKVTKDVEEFKKLDLTQPNIFLISETRFKTCVNHITARYGFEWEINRFIVDEIDTIDIGAFPEINARFSWFITGSTRVFQNPYTSFNHTGFLKNLFTDLSNGAIDLLLVRNSSEFLAISHDLPAPIIFHHQILDTSHLRVIRGFVNDTIIHALQAGDVGGAIDQLGIRQDTVTNIVDAITQSLHKQLHNLQVKRRERENYEYATEAMKQEALKNMDDKIKELETKIQDLQKRIAEEDCPICYCPPSHPVLLKCCHHRYCMECLLCSFRAMNTSRCPMCRADVDQASLMYMESNSIASSSQTQVVKQKLTKAQMIATLFDKYRNGRWLIVSSYDASFYEMRRIMDERGIRYHEPKGSADTIHSYVEKYKSGQYPVLLLNASRYASGIHLPETTDIVFYHSMTQDIETQVIGRAQRMGRTTTLRIHYFDVE